MTTCAQPGCGSGCDQPVGRDREGQPGLTEGFCRNCGTRFSFSPKLEPGDLVAGQADGRLGQLVVDDVRRQQLTIDILRAALDWCATGQPAGNGPILGCQPNARALRFGLERSYRVLARLTPDEDRRIELVDLANAIRPRTLT